MDLSGVIITKNEEENIKDCIDNLSFCDEIIVVDDNSTDKTPDIARQNGAIVFNRDKKGSFAGQRNFALTKVNARWVLFVDADERLSEDLIKEVVDIVKDKENTIMGYYLKRLDCMWGKVIKHGEMGNTKLLRFGRKNAGKWKRDVHETWEVVGKTSELKTPLIHIPHPTVYDFLININEFSDLHAKANYDEGKRSSLVKILLWPFLKFIQNYIIRLGLLDGLVGLIAAMFMSFHSYLSWSKLWMMQKNIQLHKR